MTLTCERAKELLHYDPDTGILSWRLSRGTRAAGMKAGTIHPDRYTSYLHVQVDKRMYKGHRIAWLITYGKFPLGVIDHIDGDGLNNQLSNLRSASNSQNRMNWRSYKRGKYPRGVKYDSRNDRFYAVSSLNFKSVHIGTFRTAEDASAAFEAWARNTFGEFYATGEARHG